MKRSAPSSSSNPAPAKRVASGNLSSYFNVPTPKRPEPLISSRPITDRQSTFVAHCTTVTSKHAATQFHNYIRTMRGKNHPSDADHEMLGWRTMSLRVGKTGLGGPEDYTVSEGHENDGEANGGLTVAKAILEVGGMDVAVVVSRYYGGIMLGPARFDHIRNCTTEAVQLLEEATALPALIKRLKDLDDEISLMASPTKPPSYEGLTVEKAERLIKAKEKRVEFLAAREEKLILQAVEQDINDEKEKGKGKGPEVVVLDDDEANGNVVAERSESEPAPEEEYLRYSDDEENS